MPQNYDPNSVAEHLKRLEVDWANWIDKYTLESEPCPRARELSVIMHKMMHIMWDTAKRSGALERRAKGIGN